MRCLLAAAILSLSSPALADQPPPPPPPPPQNVPPTLLEGSRISGEKMIVPDDVTKTEIQRSGKEKLVGSYKLCIDTSGVPSSVKQLKSTGFAAYDTKIITKMKAWRYKPYTVDGKTVPVCTAVTFVYTQKADVPMPTERIAAAAFAKLRITGSDKIDPDDVTIAELDKKKATTATGAFLVCIDDTGAITHTKTIKSTAHPMFDQRIEATISIDWKYRPYRKDKTTPPKPADLGKGGTPVCGPVTITWKK
jgi:hypothetical protein